MIVYPSIHLLIHLRNRAPTEVGLVLFSQRSHFLPAGAARYDHVINFWPLRSKWECPGTRRGMPFFGPSSKQQPEKQM